MWECFTCTCICMCTACAVGALGGQERAPDPWNWNYTRLWTTIQVLGIKPGFSVKTASVLNHQLSPQPCLSFLNIRIKCFIYTAPLKITMSLKKKCM